MAEIDFNRPHEHRGDPNTDGRLNAVSTGNLILNSTPDPESSANVAWGIGAGLTFNGTYDAYAFNSTTNDFLWQRIFDKDAGTNTDEWKMMGANGAPWLVSMFMRLKGTASTGKIKFGFADNSTSAWIAGHAATVDFSDLNVGAWVRVWARFDGTQSPAGGYPGNQTEFTTDTRLLIDCTENVDGAGNEIVVTGMMGQITLTGPLLPFAYCTVERIHHNWVFQPLATPLFDTAISMTNAVQITDLS